MANRQIAHIPNPPSGVIDALNARHGIAPAIVERVGRFGNTAELKLKLIADRRANPPGSSTRHNAYTTMHRAMRAGWVA